jgi:hypothetical protein
LVTRKARTSASTSATFPTRHCTRHRRRICARPDLVVAFENQTVRAAHTRITEIPVVFLHATDPIAEGIVKSLAHPGGNMTGLVSFGNAPLKEVPRQGWWN